MAQKKKIIQLYYTEKEKYLCSKCAIKIFKKGNVIPYNVVSNTSKICIRCNKRIN